MRRKSSIHASYELTLLGYRQIGFELLKGAAPALRHAVAVRVEGLLLRLRRVVGVPSDGKFRLVVGHLLERECRKHLQWPAFMPGVAGYAALLVRKRVDKHELLWRHDFSIRELAPHDLAVRGLQAVVIDAPRPQIHFGRDNLETFRAPPVRHAFRSCEAFPHQVARRIERARYDEVFDHLSVPY